MHTQSCIQTHRHEDMHRDTQTCIQGTQLYTETYACSGSYIQTQRHRVHTYTQVHRTTEAHRCICRHTNIYTQVHMGTHRLVYVWPACVCIHNHKHTHTEFLYSVGAGPEIGGERKLWRGGMEGEVPMRVPSSISYCRGVVRIPSLVRLRQCPESGELIGLAYGAQVWGFAEHGRPKAELASLHPAGMMFLPLEIPRCRITSKWRKPQERVH